MNKLYYTGIGSRETPIAIGLKMSAIAKVLGEKGYILRSGGAEGADTFFEDGVPLNSEKEIYLPWKKFNNNNSNLFVIDPNAFEIAKSIHPNWKTLSYGAKKLHARNVHQVLGLDLQTPSKFVICWTKKGESVGGTRTAIELARKYNVPVYNLAVQDFLLMGEIC